MTARSHLPLAALRRLGLALTWFRRAVTLGVRIAAHDDEGRLLLVRHTYLPGWYLPGGAVDPGESAPAAALRELKEETGLIGRDTPQLVSLYRNNRQDKRDHVALYRIDRFDVPPGALAPNREIREARFFALDALPAEVTPATRRRITELAGGAAPDEDW
ncbi:NUDIX domain-containing protein [Stappia sp.]|uniref:NUDIX domain-containing protein n=1 Tax=Stappia sp. TaxID=1870903 RepID=UPI003A995F42